LDDITGRKAHREISPGAIVAPIMGIAKGDKLQEGTFHPLWRLASMEGRDLGAEIWTWDSKTKTVSRAHGGGKTRGSASLEMRGRERGYEGKKRRQLEGGGELSNGRCNERMKLTTGNRPHCQCPVDAGWEGEEQPTKGRARDRKRTSVFFPAGRDRQ